MDDFIEVNVRGTRNVLDAARDAGARRLVHLSSIVTFGYEHDVELDEDAAARPAGIPYIDTKGASDELVRTRAERGEPVVTLRPGDVYGPGLDAVGRTAAGGDPQSPVRADREAATG